jgi:hypothetical protein
MRRTAKRGKDRDGASRDVDPHQDPAGIHFRGQQVFEPLDRKHF